LPLLYLVVDSKCTTAQLAVGFAPLLVASAHAGWAFALDLWHKQLSPSLCGVLLAGSSFHARESKVRGNISCLVASLVFIDESRGAIRSSEQATMDTEALLRGCSAGFGMNALLR
jgi:hypothetical protein